MKTTVLLMVLWVFSVILFFGGGMSLTAFSYYKIMILPLDQTPVYWFFYFAIGMCSVFFTIPMIFFIP